jgi:hypothetical protein
MNKFDNLEKNINSIDLSQSKLLELEQKVSRLSQRVNIIFDTLMRETNHSMCSLTRDDEGELIFGNNGMILQPNGEIK